MIFPNPLLSQGYTWKLLLKVCGLLVQKTHPNPQSVASSEPLVNAPNNGQEAAMTHLAQPKGEFLPDGSNWFSLGMIPLSDEGSCVDLQSPAGLWDGEEREFHPCCAMEAAVTNDTGRSSPALCPLVKKQIVMEGQLSTDDASLEARCKKRETTK